MSTYRLGSNGEEVERIQARLSELGFYRGPLDGAVGPLTWRALFGRAIPSPAIAAKPLDYKCLALTGSIGDLAKARIFADFSHLPPDLPVAEAETERMKIIAQRRADAANPRWAEDVRARKLCIAKGQGIVHGVRYSLEEQFGIGL